MCVGGYSILYLVVIRAPDGPKKAGIPIYILNTMLAPKWLCGKVSHYDTVLLSQLKATN